MELKLLKKVKDKDRVAQSELYHYTYQSHLGMVLRFTKDREEADWVFNMGMMRIFKTINNEAAQNNYDAWACTILRNACIDHYRSNKKHKETIAPVEVTDYNDKEYNINEALSNLDVEYIYELIQNLPNKDRMVFSLYEIDGYKHSEIGEMLGMSANTSKWYLAKAKKSLATSISSISSPFKMAE